MLAPTARHAGSTAAAASEHLAAAADHDAAADHGAAADHAAAAGADHAAVAPAPARAGADRLAAVVLVLTLGAYLALAFGYAALTPIWQNPDEPAHFNYVAFVARTGGLPELKAGDWDLPLLERLKNGTLGPGDSPSTIAYEGWQPPLFYLLAAPLVWLGPADDVAGLVARLRGFDVVLGALTLGVAYLVGVEVLGARLGAAVPLVMAGVPMFTAVSAAVSADPLANLLSAGLVLVLVRWARRPARAGPRAALGAGLLLGLGLLTKLALAIFGPLVLLGVLRRSARPARDAALMGVTAGLVVVPWLIHQVTTYGWADPLAAARHAAVVVDQPLFPGLSPEYAGRFLTTTFHSFWAQFGWMGVVAPDRLYWGWGLLVLAAAAGLVLVGRQRLRQPGWRVLLATLGLALLAHVGYNLSFEQPQGRYLFPALVPVAALLVAGWAAWLPTGARAWGVLLLGGLLVAVNAYALVRVLVPGFAPAG